MLRELDRLGYSGTIAIENQGQEDPRDALLHNVSVLRDWISGGEPIGNLA